MKKLKELKTKEEILILINFVKDEKKNNIFLNWEKIEKKFNDIKFDDKLRKAICEKISEKKKLENFLIFKINLI
jgi:hypothetical protein